MMSSTGNGYIDRSHEQHRQINKDDNDDDDQDETHQPKDEPLVFIIHLLVARSLDIKPESFLHDMSSHRALFFCGFLVAIEGLWPSATTPVGPRTMTLAYAPLLTLPRVSSRNQSSAFKTSLIQTRDLSKSHHCVTLDRDIGSDHVDSSPPSHHFLPNTTRRLWLAAITSFGTGFLNQRCAVAAESRIPVTITGPDDRIGLELYDVVVGSSRQSVVAIRRITTPTQSNRKLQPGMICRDYSNALDLVQRIQRGPFPITLQFENLAVGGDAMSDLGTPIVSAQDALKAAEAPAPMAPNNAKTEKYSITVLERRLADGNCGSIQTRRGDLLEIRYEAHVGTDINRDNTIYDSSTTRGTGQPYQMVLGSGDMIAGVDQGLYDMCPGDVRVLQIPPLLAYGNRGNKLFRIPPDTPLVWKVELVSVNSMTTPPNDAESRDDLEGRVPYSQ